MSNRVKKVRKQLNRHSGTYPAVAKATGLNLEWLRKFAQDRIKDPAASRLDRLEGWLEQNP